MNVQLLVTRNDFHLPNLEKECQRLGIDYDITYIEDHPELVAAHSIRHTPNILVDGELAFRRQPTDRELLTFFKQREANQRRSK